MTIYHEKNGFYIGTQKILRNIKHLMSTVAMHVDTTSTTTYETKTSSADDITTDFEPILEISPSTNTPTRTNSPKNVEFDLCSLVEKAEAATDLFHTEFINSTPKQRALLLNEALQSALEAYIFVSDKNLHQSDISLLDTLQNVLLKLYQAREKLLPVLLLDGHYIEAKWFINQSTTDSKILGCSEIDPSIVSLALKQGNQKLLEFILKETDFPIHTFSITTPKDGKVSAAMYCFLNDTATSSKTQCLNVLVKHGASLMEPCPVTGLPLAHSIISAYPKHACMIVLEENSQSTLLNRHFYHNLVCLLKAQKVSSELTSHISNYENLMKQLTNGMTEKTAIDHKQDSTLVTTYSSVKDNLFKLQNFVYLFTDSEVRKVCIELKEMNDEYSSRITDRRQKRMLKKAELDLAKMMLEPDGLDFIQSNSFETLKIKFIAHQKQLISTLKEEIIMKDMNLPMQKGFLLGRKKDIKVVNRICSERQGINRKEKKVEATNKAALNNAIKAIGIAGDALKNFQSSLNFFSQTISEITNQSRDLNDEKGTNLLAGKLSQLDQMFSALGSTSLTNSESDSESEQEVASGDNVMSL